MANPAYNERALRRLRTIEDTSRMTIEGTINRTGILLLLLMGGGVFGWNMHSSLLLIGGLILNLILAFLIIFDPKKAAYLSQPYALAEGVLLGSISSVYAAAYPGIITNAMLLTVAVFALMLGLYRFRIIKVTDRVRSVIVSATLAIAVVYFINLIMGFFGTSMPMIHQSGTYGIIFSIVVVGVAAFNLLLDFDFIERASQSGAGKFMEWYGAFALVLTIVWLYLEILRLLSKLNKK
ncbi:MAG: Bax inhibitor-1/YccA family protein [Bdellovibrionales bacterium]|nr:Bax inhibitor-1/YccA family protein [Bdellovibrionales bacterium]